MKISKTINGVKTIINLTKKEMKEIYKEIKKEYLIEDFINYLYCTYNENINERQIKKDKDEIHRLFEKYDNCEDDYWTIFSNILYDLKRTDFGLNYDYSKLK